MKQFEIFTDSGANIPTALVKEYGIHVISFTITVNGEERVCYSDDKSYEEGAKQFYEDMRAGAEIKTSLIPAEQFIEAVAPALEEGKDAFIFTIASGISGTFRQAKEAAKELEKRYKGRKVYAVDSANASMGTGLLAIKAATLRDLGESSSACMEWLDHNIYKMNSYLTVGDLKYLRKTGRISTTVAIAGTLLNIKPLLRADGGSVAKIVAYGKERGRKKAIAALAKAFEERAEDVENQKIAIMHCDCEDEANELAETVRGMGAKDIVVGYYDICTGSHVGPGTIAIFFMGADRRPSPFPFFLKQGAPVPSPAK